MDYGLSSKISPDDYRQGAWKSQRDSRGFDDTECWNLDYTFALFIHPRLQRFREMDHGWPGGFQSRAEWEEVLDKMLFAFKHYSQDLCFGVDSSEEYYSKVDEGMQLFAKYYGALWI